MDVPRLEKCRLRRRVARDELPLEPAELEERHARVRVIGARVAPEARRGDDDRRGAAVGGTAKRRRVGRPLGRGPEAPRRRGAVAGRPGLCG